MDTLIEIESAWLERTGANELPGGGGLLREWHAFRDGWQLAIKSSCCAEWTRSAKTLGKIIAFGDAHGLQASELPGLKYCPWCGRVRPSKFSGQIESQLNHYREVLSRIANYPVHSEPVGAAMAIQEIAQCELANEKLHV